MLGFRVNPAREWEWWERGNMVIKGRGSGLNYEQTPGALSIKTVVDGAASWTTPSGRYDISPETYLVLNAGRPYGLESGVRCPVQTFCVFFAPGYVEQVAASVGVRGLTGFYERLQLHQSSLLGALSALRTVQEPESMEGECALADLAMALVCSETARSEEGRLSSAKASVREDLFRRLNQARDYALCNLSRPLGLEELSGVAAMSPFHFHRLHRQAFGETPHDFLMRGRLARAKRLLRAGYAVEEVAMLLGLESSPSFWRTFKAKTGMTPAAFARSDR